MPVGGSGIRSLAGLPTECFALWGPGVPRLSVLSRENSRMREAAIFADQGRGHRPKDAAQQETLEKQGMASFQILPEGPALQPH